MGTNFESLNFLRKCFTAETLNADEIAKSLTFFINTMQRIGSIPEEKVLAAVFFISVGERLELLFDITVAKGIDDLRKKIEDFELLKDLVKKYTHKSNDVIKIIINPASGPKGFIGAVEEHMITTNYSTLLGSNDKSMWKTEIRDFVRNRIPKRS